MNAPTSTDQTAAPAPIFDPFPEPQTMPKGWDFSGLVPAKDPSTVESTSDQAEA